MNLEDINNPIKTPTQLHALYDVMNNKYISAVELEMSKIWIREYVQRKGMTVRQQWLKAMDIKDYENRGH